MKKILLPLILFCAFTFSTHAQNTNYQFPFQNPDLPLDVRVNDLVGRLTLEEKTKQMEHTAPAIERLGIVAYDWWNEALHGVARTKEEVTVFPQAIGMAASFDTEALRKAGDAASSEGRALFNEDLKNGTTGTRYRGLTYWTPNINIFRDPRWGRGQETYGEDPYLTGKMGSAMVRGLEGNDEFYLKASACAKHYAVHSGPEHNRHSFDATTSKYDLWDTYLPAFKELVEEANVSGIMCAYNRFEGAPCCGNDKLMVDILREQWRFNGYVTTDCWAISDFFQYHKTHPDALSSITDAIIVGTDLECGNIYHLLEKAVENGTVLERQINKSVKRLFEIRMRLGMFDPVERNPYGSIGREVIECDEHKTIAYEMAQKSMTLLKNNKNLLPLDRKKVKRIAVVGPNANNEKVMLSNYFGTPSHIVTALEGIKNSFPDAEVTYVQGVGHVKNLDGVTTSDVVKQVRGANVIIYVGGISADYEGEAGDAGDDGYGGFASGDRVTTSLPPVQIEMMKALKKTGKPLVFVNMSGSTISMEWENENVDAILQAWYGGQAGGTAIGDVLSGDYNPAGRMPLTTYKSDSDLPDFEDYSMENRTYRYFKGDVRFPFGYGLSYTTFAYDNISIPSEITAGDKVKISATVTNTGERDGDEVVQLYVIHKNRLSRVPNCALKGFDRIHLKKGESKVVEFTLTAQDLALVDEAGITSVSEGDIEVFIGGGQPNYAASVGSASKIIGNTYQIL
ncbi:MAG: glycoside hydrolase family 3 C-terminal domain-containing protein [Rikenellaceae bacterium]